MRRSDRLFDLIQILRDGRLHKAADLGQRLQVTPRTIWRDMATLMASGMPVEGARGIGYILRTPITLPPMILTTAELDALRHALRAAAADADPARARAAATLAAKIAAATPAAADPDDVFNARNREPARAAPHLPLIRHAIRDHEVLALTYLETTGHESHGDILPLRLATHGKVWTLTARFAGTASPRDLRVDRITALAETGEQFGQG